MKNVELVEIQPFHQLGAFKWKAMGLDTVLDTSPPRQLIAVSSVSRQFSIGGLPDAR